MNTSAPLRISRGKAVSLLALTSAAVVARPRPATAATKVQVSGFLSEGICPLYYGIKTGRFERAGLDVEYIAASTGSAGMSALLGGSVAIASSNMLSLAQAHGRGLPIVMIAPQVLYTPRTKEALLQVAADAPYKTGADLNGKTFAITTLEGINTLAAKAWVDKNGGDSSTLKFVEMPNAVQPQALVQHRVEAAIIIPPVLNASLAEGTSKTIGDPMGAIGSTYVIAAYVARTDWAAQNADALRSFTRVLRESAEYVNTHYAETAPLVAEITKIELSVVQKMERTTAGINLDAAQTQPLIDAAAKYGLLQRAFPARELFWSGA
jgi:NitT/TauT family transport system substrate-binding protein